MPSAALSDVVSLVSEAALADLEEHFYLSPEAAQTFTVFFTKLLLPERSPRGDEERREEKASLGFGSFAEGSR